MKIKSVNIKNFKSIVDLTIENPNPFTVFAGANGSGKSNIFEALEYLFVSAKFDDFEELFGSRNDIINYNVSNRFNQKLEVEFIYGSSDMDSDFSQRVTSDVIDSVEPKFYYQRPARRSRNRKSIGSLTNEIEVIEKYWENFSKIFIGKKELEKLPLNSDRKLSASADNLEKVLERVLKDDFIREEIEDWLALFIPEFDRIEVQKSDLRNTDNLLLYQKHYKTPFKKKLISDGTYNIIAILTAVFQSEKPQFLCIEEPENGLNPKVVRELVNLFRDACDQGHYIWLNTHSQTLVSQLEPKELILVDKVNGETQISPFPKGFNLHGMKLDEAWLTNALGGGLPW